MNITRTPWWAALALVGMLAGCSTPDASADDPTAIDDHESDREPRLIVATEDGVSVRSVATGEEIARFDAGTAPLLTLASDRRHVYATDLDSGRTRVIDAGTWTEEHGDHSHSSTAEPALVDTVLTAEKPSHVETGSDQVVIYDDATGTASVYDEFAVQDGVSEPVLVLTASAPHHGVALPEQDRYLVTTVAAPGDTIAGGISVYDVQGALVSSHVECPGLHGSAVVGATTVFGCRDGLLTLSAEGAVAKVAYPRTDDWRVGSFAAPLDAEGTRVAGHYGPADSSNVLVADLTDGTSAAVDVGAPYRSMIDLGGDRVAVAATTGEVVVIDLSKAAVDTRYPVIEPWELPEGHAGGAPVLAVSGDTLYLTDPSERAVRSVDLDSGATTRIDLGVAATSLVIANPVERTPHHDS